MTLSEPQVECEDDSGFQEGTVSDTTTREGPEPITTKIKLGRGKQSIVLEFENEGRNYEATIDISDICIKFKGFVDQIAGKKVNVDTSSQDSKHSDETTRAKSGNDKECKIDQNSAANSLTCNKKRDDSSKSNEAIFNEKLMLNNNKSSEINKKPNDLKKANDKNKGGSETDRFSNAKPLTISPSSVEELKQVLTFPPVFKSSPLKDVNKIPEKQIETIRNCADKLKVNGGDEKENKAAVNFMAKSMASDKNPEDTKFDSAAINKKLNEKPDWTVKSSKELKDLSNLFNNSTNKKKDFTGVEKANDDPVLNTPKLEPKCSIDPIPSWEEFSKELRNNEKLFTLGKSRKIRSVNKKSFASLCNSTFEVQLPKENSISPSNSKCSNEGILPRSSSPVAARTVVESTKENVVSSTKSVDSDRRENSIESTTNLAEGKSNSAEVAPITSKKCQNVTDSTDKLLKEKDEGKYADASKKSIKDEPASNIDSVAKPVEQPATKQEPVIINTDGSNKDTAPVSNHEDITSAQKSTIQSTSDQSRKDFASKVENEKNHQKFDLQEETNVAEKEVTCDATSKTIAKKPIATVKGCPRRNVTTERSSESSGLNRTTNSTSNINHSAVVRRTTSHEPDQTTNSTFNNDHSAIVRRTTYYEPDRTTNSTFNNDHSAIVHRTTYYEPDRTITNLTSNNDHPAVLRSRIYYEPNLYEGGLFDSLLRDLQFSSPVSRYSKPARTDIFEDIYREPFLNISGIGRTKKFNAFMQCPGDKRPVTDLPGVGEKGGQRLRALGFETTGKVHQQYLRFGRDKSAFQDWLWNVAGLNRRWSSQCFDALEMMG